MLFMPSALYYTGLERDFNCFSDVLKSVGWLFAVFCPYLFRDLPPLPRIRPPRLQPRPPPKPPCFQPGMH